MFQCLTATNLFLKCSNALPATNLLLKWSNALQRLICFLNVTNALKRLICGLNVPIPYQRLICFLNGSNALKRLICFLNVTNVLEATNLWLKCSNAYQRLICCLGFRKGACLLLIVDWLTQVLEGMCCIISQNEWPTNSSAVWFVDFYCATVTKSLKEAVAGPLPEHLLFGLWSSTVLLLPSPWRRLWLVLYQNICWFGLWSSTVLLLPSPWRRLWLVLYQNICCLVCGVLLCYCYQVLEGGCGWSSTRTSAVWFVEFYCATVTKSLKEAVAGPLPEHLLFGLWSSTVLLLPSPWRRLWVVLYQNICCLVCGVLLCYCYQVLEGGCGWSSTRTSAVCLWSSTVLLLPSPWRRLYDPTWVQSTRFGLCSIQ